MPAVALAKDSKHFDMFLAAQTAGFLSRGYIFRFDGRIIDIKISSYQIDFVSLYSIKDNKWLIKPDRNVLESIQKDEMIAYYLKRKGEILKEFQSLKSRYKGVELGNKLNDFYINTVNRSIIGFPSLKDYLVFKLLNQEGILKPIGSESILAYNEGFSFSS